MNYNWKELQGHFGSVAGTRGGVCRALLGLVVALGVGFPAGAQDAELQRRITPVVEVVQRARPAVVFIRTDVAVTRRDLFGFPRDGFAEKTGSGFLIEPDGYIVSNYHVVEGATRITVSFDEEDDPEPYVAKLLSYSKENDLALLKIEGRSDFPYLQPGSSEPLLGETVVAIGNPYGQTHTVSTGIISGLHRDVQAGALRFTNLIQTDASINPGNSGGPLLNINGELIGINTAMNREAENIGFAIPVDQLKRVLNDTLLSPDSASSWLGMVADPDAEFALSEVVPGGPAALAGLRAGDRLVALGSRTLQSDEDYRLALVTAQPEEEVVVRFEREGAPHEVTVTPWGYFDGYLWGRLGLALSPAAMGSGYRRSTYLRVEEIQDGGPAAALGLRSGDVLEAVQTEGLRSPRRLSSLEQLAWVLSRTEAGEELIVVVLQDRDGDDVFRLTGDNPERFRGRMLVR